MLFNIGDLVTRKSHNNDIVFKVEDIQNDIAYLIGVDIRLAADSYIEDLVIVKQNRVKDDDDVTTKLQNDLSLDRSEYFYLPGKILHIDSDEEYLKRCMKLYKKLKIMAYGISLKESEIQNNIEKYLQEINPDIVVITGHDAYYKNIKKERNSEKLYKNSDNFIKAVQRARKHESSHDKLIIIAGACQSNYEDLIKSGANFASSPKRINIHALDPAIVASKIALSSKNEPVDLLKILKSTKYGENGMGGIITNGTMYRGYPR